MRKLLTTALPAALLVAGCSTPAVHHPNPEASYSSWFYQELNREMQLGTVLVACFARQAIIPARDLDRRWYRNGRVIRNRYWTQWWSENKGLPVKVNGRWVHLDDVARHAAEKSAAWPAKLCGSLPSPAPGGP